MVGYIITIDPVSNTTTWEGITLNFTIEMNGTEVAVSYFDCKDFTGYDENVVLFFPVEGFGKLNRDTRCGIQPINGPAFYYGVITSTDSSSNDVIRLNVSDMKKYLDITYVDVPRTEAITNPIHFISDLFTEWSINSPMDVSKLTNISYTGPAYKHGNPTQMASSSLLDLASELFRYHQVTMVTYGDKTKDESAESQGEYNPHKVLYSAFISGEDFGTLLIDVNRYIRSPSVYVRPVMNGEPNGIQIIEGVYNDAGEFLSIKKTKRYIDIYSEIKSDPNDENIAKPIKPTTVLYSPQYEYDTQGNEILIPFDPDKIAQDNLLVPKYAHEISFLIHRDHPQINKIRVGNTGYILHNGQQYKSIVNDIVIDSTSEFISVTCGNLSATLGDLANSGNSYYSSGSSYIGGGSGGGTGDSNKYATEVDIDEIIASSVK